MENESNSEIIGDDEYDTPADLEDETGNTQIGDDRTPQELAED